MADQAAAMGAAGSAAGGKGIAVRVDHGDDAQGAALFDQGQREQGRLDILVNNAAANFPVPAEDMSPNAWRTVVDITLTGTFLMSREFARRHLAAPQQLARGIRIERMHHA